MLGPERNETLFTQSDIARSLLRQGRNHKAESLTQDTVTKYRKLLGDQHRQTLIVKSFLANCLNNLHRYEEAKLIAREVVSTAERILGPNSGLVGDAAAHAGIACHGQGRSAEGLELLGTAVKISSRICESEDPQTRVYKSFHTSMAQEIADSQGLRQRLRSGMAYSSSWPTMEDRMVF